MDKWRRECPAGAVHMLIQQSSAADHRILLNSILNYFLWVCSLYSVCVCVTTREIQTGLTRKKDKKPGCQQWQGQSLKVYSAGSYKYDVITALCNDIRTPRQIRSGLRACCYKYLNPHPLLLPQSPISVSKPSVFKSLLWTDGCQHSKISFIVTTPERNMPSLTQLTECTEYEKKKWNRLTKLHRTVTIRTRNMTSDCMCPALFPGLCRDSREIESHSKGMKLIGLHRCERTKEKKNSVNCYIFYKTMVCLYLQ